MNLNQCSSGERLLRPGRSNPQRSFLAHHVLVLYYRQTCTSTHAIALTLSKAPSSFGAEIPRLAIVFGLTAHYTAVIMSASPADGTPGRTPNGGVAPVMRRPKKVDPLVRPKPRKPPQAQRPPATNGVPSLQSNGLRAPSSGQPHVLSQHPSRPPYAASGPFQSTSNAENSS